MRKINTLFRNMQEARMYGQYADGEEMAEVFKKFSYIVNQFSVDFNYNIRVMNECVRANIDARKWTR